VPSRTKQIQINFFPIFNKVRKISDSTENVATPSVSNYLQPNRKRKYQIYAAQKAKRQKVEEALWDFEVNGHVMEKLKYQIQISIAIRESVRN
jgi:hypothetical protein